MNRTHQPRSPSRLRAVYTIQELAGLLGISPKRVRRMVLRSGIRVSRTGRRILVPISVFRVAFPELWESMVEMQQLRAKG